MLYLLLISPFLELPTAATLTSRVSSTCLSKQTWLLPPAHGRGPGATYDLGHLLRLRMIQILKSQHFPLQDIKQRLGDLSDQEIAALMNVQTEPAEDVWRRIELHQDIELHVRQRKGKSREMDRAIDLIIGLTRPVIERMDAGE